MSAEARLKELGLVLPAVPKPVANYLPYRLAGNLLFLAGQGPRDEKGAALTGKLGAEIGIDEGYRRARLVGLGLLAAMRDALVELGYSVGEAEQALASVDPELPPEERVRQALKAA